MFPSVSCFVSPRKGEAPLSLEENNKKVQFIILLHYYVYDIVGDATLILGEVNLQDVSDDTNAPHVCFQSKGLIVDNLWSFTGNQYKNK